MAHVLASELRESVLVAAMTGRLTKQVDEESSLDLLETIRKNKKIKNKIKDMENDFPYDIPESWLKPKLGEVFDVIMGQSPDNSSITNVKTDNSLEFHQGKILFTKDLIGKSDNYAINPNKIAPKNSVLLCVRAPIGTVNWTDRDLSIGRGLCSIIPVAGIKTKFTMILLKTLNDEFVKQGTGSTFKAITADVILNQRIPLPPIEEQARIVTRVDELMTKIDEYEKLENELVELKKNFPGDMKAAVLQTAMQGKLTEQLESDSDVFETLSKIKQMKEDLCKSKVIKKDIVYDAVDELYDIPDNWIWTHVGEVCVYAFNGKSPEYVKTNNGNYTLGQAANQNDGIHFEVSKFCSDAHKNKCDEYQFLKENDTLLNTLGGGSVGRVGIFHNPENYNCLTDGHIFVFRTNGMIDERYFFYYMKSNQKEFERMAEGSTNQSFLKLPTIKNYPFPLPPIEEQRRIVEKLDQLLPLCEELVNLC